ncbi:4-alpha-glucanotransferase [Natranaerovirga pectinivora]|uniref:4-alpha-glucanotransferase n=1 Tax=Natranaerovirga pectinivora TaxID=682400 RepID=A0A4V2V0C5_9FIRM|nr:4-alpha-glucanotransferase [Natranaerovirga pectinivora]TCT15360.1 4-alpha-glucanotransferase [Natranaerovirga pectinivora]
MIFNKSSGILLHITSLPSRYGIGDFGDAAHRFIDLLKKSKQSVWQILPLNPIGFGNSPYQSYSAFAGNHLLISIDELINEKLLDPNDIIDLPAFNDKQVNFLEVKKYKEKLLERAFQSFEKNNQDYNRFNQENNEWLENYALFMALKTYFNHLPWNKWEKGIAFRNEKVIKLYREKLKKSIEYEKFIQYIFFKQWAKLKKYANSNGIKIIGDVPIFVSYDSCDAWSNPDLFKLDELGNPIVVAGVPPDYFSEKGQLWGNPLYKWDLMKSDGYKWWVERINLNLRCFDSIRLDHFRGFEAYWEILGDADNAMKGKWVKGPGEDFFNRVINALGDVSIIAEDLGIITDDVIKLKDKFGFPGMKVLQFTLEDLDSDDFYPEKFDENTFVYTGTHDNDTILSWYGSVDAVVKECIEMCYGISEDMVEEEVVWRFIELAFGSNGSVVVIPLQDVLCLGGEGRMNTPGTVGGNWEWRFSFEELSCDRVKRLRVLTERYNRVVE